MKKQEVKPDLLPGLRRALKIARSGEPALNCRWVSYELRDLILREEERKAKIAIRRRR